MLATLDENPVVLLKYEDCSEYRKERNGNETSKQLVGGGILFIRKS